MAAPVTIDYVASWKQRLGALLYEQFKNDPSWNLWVTLLARQAQDIEDATQSMFLALDIANGSGAILDSIGGIVGQPRLGASDPIYQLYLAARVLANESTGTPEQIYTILGTLFAGALSVYKPGGVKAYAVQLVTPSLVRAQALIAAEFIQDVDDVGARAIFEWTEAPAGETFTFDQGANSAEGFDSGFWAGAVQA